MCERTANISDVGKGKIRQSLTLYMSIKRKTLLIFWMIINFLDNAEPRSNDILEK